MWYKHLIEEIEGELIEEWLVAERITTTDGKTHDINGRDFDEFQGYIWSDEPPQEYLEFKQNEE